MCSDELHIFRSSLWAFIIAENKEHSRKGLVYYYLLLIHTKRYTRLVLLDGGFLLPVQQRPSPGLLSPSSTTLWSTLVILKRALGIRVLVLIRFKAKLEATAAQGLCLSARLRKSTVIYLLLLGRTVIWTISPPTVSLKCFSLSAACITVAPH